MLGFKISRNRCYFRQSPLGFLTFELRFLLLRLRQEGLFLCVVRAYACVGEACLCRRDSVCFCCQGAIFPRTKTHTPIHPHPKQAQETPTTPRILCRLWSLGLGRGPDSWSEQRTWTSFTATAVGTFQSPPTTAATSSLPADTSSVKPAPGKVRPWLTRKSPPSLSHS